MNTLKSLIQHYLELQNLKRSGLATKLGYTNITGCLRKVDLLIEHPGCNNPLLAKLQSILQIPSEEFELAINQRLEYIEEENTKRFRPFIQTIVSSRPSPIFVAAIAPQLWNIPVESELQLLGYEKELATVVSSHQQLQLEHAKNLPVNSYSELVTLLNEHDSNDEPYSWLFGKGFRYFRKCGETMVFNRECILQKKSESEQPSIAYVSI
jgi:hypothetical protein